MALPAEVNILADNGQALLTDVGMQNLSLNNGFKLQPFPVTAYGRAFPASPEEIAKEEQDFVPLTTDTGFVLLTDSGVQLNINIGRQGYTNPNLHRRIDNEIQVASGTSYPFVIYDENGDAYRQMVLLGVWDKKNSYRSTETFIHDEESETCEIP